MTHESGVPSAVIVETFSGGCGGVTREDRRYPGATDALASPTGQLLVLAGPRVVAEHAPGTWVRWRMEVPASATAPAEQPRATRC
jgi:hypothetical protein